MCRSLKRFLSHAKGAHDLKKLRQRPGAKDNLFLYLFLSFPQLDRITHFTKRQFDRKVTGEVVQGHSFAIVQHL